MRISLLFKLPKSFANPTISQQNKQSLFLTAKRQMFLLLCSYQNICFCFITCTYSPYRQVHYCNGVKLFWFLNTYLNNLNVVVHLKNFDMKFKFLIHITI